MQYITKFGYRQDISPNLVVFGEMHKGKKDYMYDSKQIAARIKDRAKQQGKSVKEMLFDCRLGVNTVGNISRGGDILTLNFAKIADYLDCSVDYLLGRTDNPEINR